MKSKLLVLSLSAIYALFLIGWQEKQVIIKQKD